jgi:CheY-like chemotaxis protein/HPt (histidine-containing phosphotransfer) domain-containing protein
MGGRLEARSEPGSGSTFSFRVALKVAAEAAPSEAPDARRKPRAGSAMRALVVDDDPVNRRVASGLLAELGVEATEVDSGRAAIAELGKSGFDFALMDCSMPGMDGYEASRAIRGGASGALDPKMPIIAMTARSQDRDMTEALGAGMDDYLAKPITLAAMAQILDRLSSRAQARKAGEAAAGKKGGDREAKAQRRGAAFDSAAYTTRYEGSWETGREILEIFLAQTDPILEEAKAAAEIGDSATVDLRVHRLKGTAATVGGMRAARAAEAILAIATRKPQPQGEEAAKAFREPMKKLSAEIAALEAEIRRYMETRTLE